MNEPTNGTTPHGWYWEIIHVASGERVNDGYSRAPMTPGESKAPRLKGFIQRVTPLYTPTRRVEGEQQMTDDPKPPMDLSDVPPHRMAEALSDLAEYEQAQQQDGDGVHGMFCDKADLHRQPRCEKQCAMCAESQGNVGVKRIGLEEAQERGCFDADGVREDGK